VVTLVTLLTGLTGAEAVVFEEGWGGVFGAFGFGAEELHPGFFVGDELFVLDEDGPEAEGVLVAGAGEVVVRQSSGLIPVAGQAEAADGEGVEEVFVTGEAVENGGDFETLRGGDWERGAEVEGGRGEIGERVLGVGTVDDEAVDVVGDGLP
jgi:hypothetical protein